MKVYIVMIQDRHADTEAHPFSTPELAIAFARQAVQDNARHSEDIEEHEPPTPWLFYATYSVESDSAWIVPREIDDPEAGE